MFMRKGPFLVCLAVAAAALAPGSASGAAGGTDRPVMTWGSGTVSINFGTFAATGNFTGVGTGGTYTAHLDGTLKFVPEGVEVTGSQTIVQSNGDELRGSITITGPGTPGPHQTTEVMTVTGGSGRYSDASGTLTTISQTGDFSWMGATLNEEIKSTTTTGQISY